MNEGQGRSRRRPLLERPGQGERSQPARGEEHKVTRGKGKEGIRKGKKGGGGGGADSGQQKEQRNAAMPLNGGTADGGRPQLVP